MSSIIFKVAIVKKDKGRYGAFAKEFPTTAEPASTQRGAIKKLHTALALRIRQAAETGTLPELLENAGYSADLIFFDRAKLIARPFNEDTVSLLVTRRLALLDRAKRSATDDERNQA